MNRKISGIKSWKTFRKKVRLRGCNLLSKVDDFPDSIFVTGCQRSGTTILSRVISQSEGMTNYWFGKDDELDAALILSGYIQHEPKGRYCFQTTYLNECYNEYFSINQSFKMIWVIRNPYSVVYSLVYNWRRWALNELFAGCGANLLDSDLISRYNLFGPFSIPKIVRATLSYNGKLSQVFELYQEIGPHRIKIVDYDDMVRNKVKILSDIYRFVEIPFKMEYADMIHSKSLNKQKSLNSNEKLIIQQQCMPIYDKIRNNFALNNV